MANDRSDLCRDLARERREALVIVALAALVHGLTVRNGYSLDDGPALLFHPAVNGQASVWEAFTREFWGEPLASIDWGTSYRPLTTLTFGLEHGLTSAPWLHHLVNLVLYVVACVGTLGLARRWLTPAYALAAAIFFTVLPVHVENVSSIVGRADVLGTLSCMAAFELALPRSGDPPTWWRALGAGALTVVGILFKETVTPFIGIVTWFALLAALPRPAAERWVWLRAPIAVAIATAAYLGARQVLLPIGLAPDFVPAQNQLVMVHGVARVVANLAIVGEYAELLFVPVRLCPDHTYADVVPVTSPFDPGGWRVLVGVAFAAVVVVDFVRATTGRSPGLWVATALAYVLIGQWVTNLVVIVGERLLFWPSVWLCIAIAESLARRSPPEESLRRLLLPLSLLAVAFAARSTVRTLDWYDNHTLHRAAVEVCPRSVHSRLILANQLRDRGEPVEAVWHYGVAGAGRTSFPRRLDLPAFDAERELPLEERLVDLPALVGVSDERAFWFGLHRYLVSTGALGEAAVVEQIVIQHLDADAETSSALDAARQADPWPAMP